MLGLLLAADGTLSDVRTLVTAGKYHEAQQKAATLDAAAPGVAHLQGVIAYHLRQYDEAISRLRAASTQEPAASAEFRESATLLGQGYYLKGKFPEAAVWLEKARSAGDRTQEVAYMLGNAYLQTQDAARARTAFAALFGLALESAGAHLLTAQMAYRLELHELAEAEARQALKSDARLPGAHQMLGEMAAFRNRIDESVREFEQELAANPNSSQAYYRLGEAYSRAEQWDKCIAVLQRSIWLSPFNSGPYIVLGKAYLKTQSLDNAEGMLRHAIQLDPQNYSAHYLLGQTLLQAGKTEEGRQALQKWQQLRGAR